MDAREFEVFVKRVCEELERISKRNPARIEACKSGDDFELCVAAAAKMMVDAAYPGADVEHISGSHAFPDIVVTFAGGERYGIEVKSSSSVTSKHWKINGNSILGSTKKDVFDTYIIFGKTAKGHQAFRYKRYEEAIANVGVTHSPRYMIDMDLDPEETFFAKSGLSYQEISDSENPIGLITDYFKKQGLQAWWLAESTAPALRLFQVLSPAEQSEIIGYCFAHFPEIFSASQKKYYRSAVWMIMNRSVVSTSLRDSFSAGGRIDMEIDGTMYTDISKVFGSLSDDKTAFISALKSASVTELEETWSYRRPLGDSIEERLRCWTLAASACMDRKAVGDYDPEELLSTILRGYTVSWKKRKRS